MTALWTSADAAAATGGHSTRDWQASGVSIDTRSLRPGDLFVALTDVRDGHDFVAQALEKGASAALVSRRPDRLDKDAPLLVVDDVLDALNRLGAAGRARTQARVIGVTGSVGKTSTKEMLRAALAGQGRVHAAEASFNNHWGVPLTLARLPQDADFAVVEIGMNHPGEIAPLARLARPHLALVTTVAAAHLEAFADLAAIAREKASIFEGLEPHGHAVFNGDLETSPCLAEAARAAGSVLRSFGEGANNTDRLISARLTPQATVCKASIGGVSVLYKLATPGRHFATNAVAVLGTIAALGLDLALAAQGLGRWLPPSGRGTLERLGLDPTEPDLNLILIDDAFNANPSSMAAALEILAAVDPVDNIGRVGRGRRIAVMGDMLELGPDEIAMHCALADLPAMKAIDVIHCAGPRMRALYQRLPEDRRGIWTETAAELAAQTHSLIDAGDVLLIKGSKGSRVSLVVDAVRKLSHPLPTQTEDIS